MSGATTPSVEREEDRIRLAYARRKGDRLRYSWFNPSYVFFTQERERQLLEMLSRRSCAPLKGKRILEVGCGTGYWLRELIKWGAEPKNIAGIDLLPDRVAEAKQSCPDTVTILCGSASNLEWPDDTFDLVLQSTVFSSVLAHEVRRKIAAEMLRVLRPKGSILWYDLRVNNPKNPDVRGLNKNEIGGLFPGCDIELNRITLAPPLTRQLAPHSWTLCHLMERIPWLCSHFLGIIQKR